MYKLYFYALFLTLTACGGGGSKGPPATTVSLKASPDEVLISNSTTLTWSTSNATNCIASGAMLGKKTTGKNAYWYVRMYWKSADKPQSEYKSLKMLYEDEPFAPDSSG